MKTLPQVPAFDPYDATVLQFMQAGFIPKLSQEEALEWQAARAG